MCDRQVMVISAATVCLLAGCEALNQDLKGIGSALKPTSPGEAARMMVDPHDADRRREGTVLISGASFGGTPTYVAIYRDMVLHDTDPIVRATAIRALGRHGGPQDAITILPNLQHANPQVRWEAAKALQRLHNPDSIVELLRVLRNESERPEVRVAAVIALGQYPQDRVFQGLVGALNARELAVNAAAEQSLHTLTGQSYDMDGRRWLAWYNSAVMSGDPFAGAQEYLYPTYTRKLALWEKLAFWRSYDFEQPAPPAGLGPSQRQTYPPDEPAPRAEPAG